ncbi:ParB/RepB/Spo0J family partition protein [bacterium]|nr:ParB/RepB/Spo0J family partition protein [bacterium]
MNVIAIPLKEILRDFFFSFASDAQKPGLERSIRASGILNPIPVLAVEGGWRPVAGFSRIRAAESTGLKTVPGRVLSPETPAWRHFADAVLEHAATRPLNLFDKARIVDILRRAGAPDAEIVGCCGEALELSASAPSLDELAGLLDLEPSLRLHLERFPTAFKQASFFMTLDPSGRKAAADMGRLLQLRPVELTEVVRTAWEISRRDSRPLDAVLAEASAQDSRPAMNRNERIAALKNGLKRMRQPRLTEWNESLNRAKNGMRLPQFCALTWDASLESPGLRLEALLRTESDASELALALGDSGTREGLCSMFELL